MKRVSTILVSLGAVAIAGPASAFAQNLECDVLSAGGSIGTDNSMHVVGQFAVGSVSNGVDSIDQGVVPCWTTGVVPCEGDLDGDLDADLDDLTLLLQNFQGDGVPSPGGDIDGDGDTDLDDLTLLLQNFGVVCN
jgi:hypothetical protein